MRWLIVLLFGCSLFGETTECSLGELGSVRYIEENGLVTRVERVGLGGEVVYTHEYHYNDKGKIVSESLIGGLGEVEYGLGFVKSPYGEDRFEYDENGNVICQIRDGVIREYEYDAEGKLISDRGESEREFSFDEEGLLVQVGDVRYDYVNGQKASREVNGEKEFYVYLGINELAIVGEDGKVKQLRIPGLSSHESILRPIAIETGDAVYAPIHDVQGNIMSLVNIETREVIKLNWADPYGQGISEDAPTPWIFAGKNYDQEAGVVYFGARYYSPELTRWLTTDPLEQSKDLYEFCLSNPLKYVDLDGQWAFTLGGVAWGAGAVFTSPFWGPYAIAAGTGAAAGYLGYKMYKNWKGDSESNFTMERSKKGGVDPSLPKNPEKDKNWEDISHPEAKSNGHHKYRNKKTGEIIELDKGKSGNHGHKGHDHYHRPNPKSIGDRDKYLDENGNPVSNYSEESHLYPPEWVWW